MNMKRMRSRNHRPGNGGSGGTYSRNQQNGIPLNRNHVFDSSGPEMRLRGTAQQLHEKYTQMARDASSGGDRVTGEAYYQHAEHYFRIINAINQAQAQNQPQPQINNGQQHYGQNGQQNAYGGNQPTNNDYRRPPHNNGANGYGQEPAAEPAEPRGYEPRTHEPRVQEPRVQETRAQEPRFQEPRVQETRPQEPRQNGPRPDYQERRPERPREAPADRRLDRRIDISSALEAELEAATAAPAFSQPAPETAAQPTEPRAIPIAAAPPEEAAPPARRPRGRPRLVRPEASKGDIRET